MKRHATLIELLIALVLTGALLSFLLSTLLTLSRTTPKLEGLATYALHTRLKTLLPQITDRYCFFDGNSLVFSYNNGIDDDPLFCAEVLGKLYLEKGALLLATWPLKECDPRPYRVEVLKVGVQRFNLTFYEPPTDEAYRSEEGLPALIKVKIDDFAMNYPVPAAKKPVRCWN